MTLAPEGVWRTPTRFAAVGFWLRSRLLIAWHFARTCGARPTRWRRSDALCDAAVVAGLRLPIWRDADAEFALTAGKVQNLRIAVRAFDGVVIPAGACLSFWRQLGRPVARRGFAVGREVRAGCVIPTIGGGICQVSNALATCAVRAGFELVERHRHTAAPHMDADGSGSVDATVFWNYVDLKIRAPVDWRIEMALTATEMIVGFRAQYREAPPRTTNDTPGLASPSQPRALRNCYGCDETHCFRHRAPALKHRVREAWLLDAWTPELSRELRARRAGADAWAPVTSRHLRAQLRRDASHDDFTPMADARMHRVWRASLQRMAWQRACARRAGARQRSLVEGQRWLADAYARRLRPEHVHLVVDQALLPHLHRRGVLGGRSYEVFAPALPMLEIERRLDEACGHAVHDSAARATLADFRVVRAVADAELEAMLGADLVITPHADVAAFWRSRGLPVRLLSWSGPPSSAVVTRAAIGSNPVIVFPASALARKGAYVLAAALRGIDCRLRILGSRSDDRSLFAGIDTEYRGFTGDVLQDARLVVLPAYVEHSPRIPIVARAKRIPIVATPAVGLERGEGVTLVAPGDVDTLRQAVLALLAAA